MKAASKPISVARFASSPERVIESLFGTDATADAGHDGVPATDGATFGATAAATGTAITTTASVDAAAHARRAAAKRARALVRSHETDLTAWREASARQGVLSRRIGEARRAGDDVSGPMAEMRSNSATRQAIETVLTAVLERLLAMKTELASDACQAVRPGPRHLGSNAVRTDRDDDRYTVARTVEPSAWDAYVAAHPARTACHVHAFGEVAERAYGLQAPRLAVVGEQGGVAGVLPLVRLEHRLFGRALVSLPWVNYGGPLADTPRAEAALMSAAADLLEPAECDELEVRETQARSDWPGLSHKLTMTLALPDTDEALDRSLGARLRAQCGKAGRAGATFRTGGAELLDDFHAVMSVNMRDLGTPFHPQRFFAELLRALGPLARIAIVHSEGRPVAAALLLSHASTLEISWASALRRERSLDPNMFLYRHVLRYAVERGYATFDFGRSSPDSATLAFKRQWGAVPSPLHWHYRRADGAGAPDLEGERARFDLAVAVWKRLPVPISRVLGPRLSSGLR